MAWLNSKENRLLNYWKTVNGKKLWFADPVVTPKTVTSLAQPVKAQTAIKEASKAGAFTLSDNKEPVKESTPASSVYGKGNDAKVSWIDYSRDNPDYTYENWKTDTGGGADPTIIINEATGKPFTYNELVSRNMLSDEFKKANAQYKELFGKDLQDAPTDLESASWTEILKKKVENQKKQQESDLNYAQRQADIAKEIDKSQLSTAQKQSASAVEATKGAFGATDREGVTSVGNKMVSTQFTAQMEKNMRERTLQVESAQNTRDKYMEDLRKAQESDNEDLAESLAEQLAGAEEALRNAQAARDTEAANQVSTTLDILSKMPTGTLANMEIDSLMGMGLDSSMASVLKSLDSQRMTAQLSDPDYITKMNQAMTAGMTNEQKNFLAYKDLLKSDPEYAKQFAVQVGIDKSPTAEKAFDQQIRWNEYALKYYNDTGTWPSQNGQTYSDGSVDDNTEVGAKGGQCGAYVNNYFGTKLFGDSLTNKKAKINSDTPVAGGAFISKYGYNLATIGQTGHVGLVTKVYEDGSFDIKDSNRAGDELVDTSHIDDPLSAGIIGYFDPSKSAKGWNPTSNLVASTSYTAPILPTGEGMGKQLTEKDAILAQMKAGNMTPSEYTKYRNMAKDQGWLDEFTKVQNDPKTKPLTSTEAEKYNLPMAVTQYQADEILTQREQQGYGNKTFQSFMFDPSTGAGGFTSRDLLAQSIHTTEDVDKALLLFTAMKDKYGNFLKDWKNKTKRQISKIMTGLGYDASQELQDYNDLMSLAGNALVKKIKDISGVAVSEQEYQRLQKYNPNVESMNDQTFLNQLVKIRADMEDFQNGQAKAFGLKDSQSMRDIIDGKVQIPSTLDMQENVSQEIPDPLEIIPQQSDPLNIF